MRQRPSLSRAALTALFVMALAGGAAAQIGRVQGLVRDDEGQPIKGATVTAENPNTAPSSFTATADAKGRFAMIGLRSGQWKFTAKAPGFESQAGEMAVRRIVKATLNFNLGKSASAAPAGIAGITARDLQADLAVADQLFNQRKWDEAVAAYRAVMVKAPTLSAISLQIAAAYRNKKDYDAALAAYNDLLKVDPGNEKANAGIGMTNLEKGDVKAADETLSKAAEGPTTGGEVYFTLGEVKLAQGETDEAVKWYQKAAAADPSWGKPWLKLGLCALGKGDKEGAAKMMEKVIAIDPVSSEAAQAKDVIDQLKK